MWEGSNPEVSRLSIVLRMIAKILHGQNETGQLFATELKIAAGMLAQQEIKIRALEDKVRLLNLALKRHEYPTVPKEPKPYPAWVNAAIKKWRTFT